MGSDWKTFKAALPSEPNSAVKWDVLPIGRTVSAQFSAEYTPVVNVIQAMNDPYLDAPISRDLALRVPAVQSGVRLIANVATLPLIQHNAVMQIVPHPLLGQIERNRPNLLVVGDTIRDMVLGRVAWWRVTERQSDGYPYKAEHIAPDRVSISEENGRKIVRIDGRVVQPQDVIKFEAPSYGLCEVGGKPIRRALLVDAALALYAKNPRALDYFTETGETSFDSVEAVDEALEGWREGRRSNSTGFVPRGLQYNTVDMPADLYTSLLEMGKAATLDIANLLNLDSEDFNISTTSRTYANMDARVRARINDVLAPYMAAITARLSMGDVTRRGYTVEFDTARWLDPDPLTRVQYYEAMARLRAITPEEIRMKERLGPMPELDDRGPVRAEVIEEEQLAIAASDEDPRWKFEDNDPTPITFDGSVDHTFSVDVESRTITGIVVPYGPKAISSLNRGHRFRFAEGSVRYTDISRVKLLVEHDRNQAIGKATSWREAPSGIEATFKVAEGPEGDRALSLAAEGVRDGLSIGADFNAQDVKPDPLNRGVYLVNRALAKEVSLVAIPSFDDSRLTSVRASYEEGTGMDPDETTETAPADQPVTFSTEQFEQLMARLNPPTETAGPEVIDPTGGTTRATFVNEAIPYRFDGGAADPDAGIFEFSSDVFAAMKGDYEAKRRIEGSLHRIFAVTTSDVDDTFPTAHTGRYIEKPDYRTPLWNMVRKGGLPEGKRSFDWVKHNSESDLVADHTEGVEPVSGTVSTGTQVVTPTAISGKVSIPRELVDIGGNPNVTRLILNRMDKAYYKALETSTATFLNTLTAAADITLAAGSVDEDLAAAWDAALADLQFIEDYDFSAFAMEKNLYKAFVAARDTAGRVLYPVVAPQNANGTAETRFRTLDLAGVTGVPSWALPATAGSPNNSWLFDPECVDGWATGPTELRFPGTDASGGYAPVAMIDLAIWGYKAFACNDIGGVRQVIYDTTA